MNPSLPAFLDELEKIGEVSPYQQETQHTCSAASLKAVLLHWGVEKTEGELSKLIGVHSKGAEVDEITAAAKKLGFKAYDKELSWKEVDALLEKDIPIICDIRSFTKNHGHYVVLAKADKTHVDIMDPNTKGNWRRLTRAAFDARWWDWTMAPPHKKMIRWGLVITPK